MVILMIKYLFLFLTGAIIGWGLEVVYRRYFGKARDWINPGFLSGPYLPLYGVAVCMLYIISELKMDTWQKLLIAPIAITLIEFITGSFFLRYYKTRLWDYRKLKFNLHGHIAPLYTFFWAILSIFFYYVLYPQFYSRVEFLYEHIELSFFIGTVYGIIIMDTIQSLNVINRLKHAVEMAEGRLDQINFDQFKLNLRQRLRRHKDIRKPSFLLPFKGEFKLSEQIKLYLSELREDIEERIQKGE